MLSRKSLTFQIQQNVIEQIILITGEADVCCVVLVIRMTEGILVSDYQVVRPVLLSLLPVTVIHGPVLQVLLHHAQPPPVVDDDQDNRRQGYDEDGEGDGGGVGGLGVRV